MKKLNIQQLMNLSTYIESGKLNLLLLLIDLNNEGKIEKFFKMIGKPDILKEFYAEEKKQKKR